MSATRSDEAKRRSAERAAHAEHRRLARERIAVLRAKLKDATTTRNAKMKEIVAACREHRQTVRAQIKKMWTDGRRAIRERADAERRRVREKCAADKARAKQESATAVERARAELAAEKNRVESERRIGQQEREQHDAHQRSHDSGAAHASVRLAMLGAFGPLYDRVRPVAGESRPEAILRYAETHPEEAHAVLHPAAERAITETKAQIVAAERALDAPTTTDLERAHRSRKRRAKSGAKPSAPVRQKGELARQGGGMLLEDLVRERDELAVEKALRKEAKARGKSPARSGPRLVSSNEGAAQGYGVRWTSGTRSGREGWVLRGGDGSPAWTGSHDEARERAKRMTLTSNASSIYTATIYPGPSVVQRDDGGVRKLALVKKNADEPATNDAASYGIRWRRRDGAEGWLIKGKAPWEGTGPQATARVLALNENAHGATKYEKAPFSKAAERAWRAEQPEAKVKAPELRDTAGIAKRIRADIAEAVKKTELPKATYSVRTSKYSMGSSIDVEASKLPFPVINPDAFFAESGANYARFDSSRFRSRFTPAAQDVEAKLNAIVGSYNWDKSDYGTDYVNVRFHGDVRMTEDAAVWKRIEAEKVAAARTAG